MEAELNSAFDIIRNIVEEKENHMSQLRSSLSVAIEKQNSIELQLTQMSQYKTDLSNLLLEIFTQYFLPV